MKDLAPRTGVIRAPYTRPPFLPVRPTSSAAIPAPLHPGLWKTTSSTTTRVNNPIDSRFLCTQIRRGRSGPGPIATGTSSKTTKRRRTMIKLTAAGITDSTPHRTRASLRHGTSPSGDMYITPAPADLIRWKHHQFHPQPPSPLLTIPSDLLPSSSSPDMSYHHSSSMSRPVYECRYCSPGRTFDDWRPLAIHEACDHADILNRIPCPADGCDKHYAQLKYLITHYNIHSGRLTHCPKCQKGYTDPSRASRCRQSHDRHFRCPRCDYSNARADLVKQHCKKKHPTLGDLTTSQLESEPSPISEPQACPGDGTSSSSFVFHAQPTPAPSASCVNLDPALDSDEQLQQQGLPTSAPPVSRYALAQAAETRRQQMIVELRASHVGMSGLTEEQFDLALPEYPIKSGSSSTTSSSSSSSPDHPTGIVGAAGNTNNMYIQGTNDEFFGGFDTSAPTATHHHHQHHAQQQQHAHQHQGTMSAPTTPTRGSPVGSYHHMQSTTTTPVHELSAPSWHDAATTTTGAQAPSSSLGGLIPATTHHQHHYAQGGGANYQLATAPAGHHHPHHQHHPHHAAHPHHSPSSSSASYQTRPPLHPSGYPGPPHSSPSRSSSIGSYYSPTSPAGWAADPALGLMGTGTTTTTATTASAGSAYPASTTTPPAMEYVGGQAWTQSSATAAGAGGPQEYSTLSNFQGQHAHHRRDYSI